MGLLVNGKWVDQWYDTKKTGGKFVRPDSSFRDVIGSDKFPAEANRYHLYISHACPWAHRTVIFRVLKGLEGIISISSVDPFMGETGWSFGSDQDPLNHKTHLHQIYTLANPTYTGRVTVPVLWDKKEKTIVNNESSEIIRFFNTAFAGLVDETPDYYPKDLRPQIDEINEFIYQTINNGVYKAGFATAQDIYEKEVSTLFQSLDTLEERLSRQRYLVGKTLTEADWRLFTTLLRFDPVYVGHFKCNLKRIADYPNLSNYLRELYQIKGIKETVRTDHIKVHYYKSHLTLNPTGIVPQGPILNYDEPHNRGRL
ncbi:MAG: glutathione S-transferase family protein [Alphaproteobacteria bacterium]|nr:glutathione S-transferase family protein [Alphaproteobacteria bacterium]NCQ67071.1 glutathione S-transferase family protein [Alphaproteobacteria bacterium]NCT07668.1 glutathione S-transferase family protein [Alphaproteobacteria bacterium]